MWVRKGKLAVNSDQAKFVEEVNGKLRVIVDNGSPVVLDVSMDQWMQEVGWK